MINECIDVSEKEFDVVIVGGGIAGSLIAKQLGIYGKKVLILEAGESKHMKYLDYQRNLDLYYSASVKSPNSPFSSNSHAPQPDELDVISKIPYMNSKGYFIQMGPTPYRSDYTRHLGGATLHWLGTCLRMIPDDFKTKTKFGVGLDWPLTYEELRPYYEQAEYEIGISGEVNDQRELGQLLNIKEEWFGKEYVFPMHKIPESNIDKYLSKQLEGKSITFQGHQYSLKVTSTPQARNGIPNMKYRYRGEPYKPVGAVGNDFQGKRCVGYSSCVPICPIQAKYSALKTLDSALKSGNVTIVSKAVVTEIKVDGFGKVEKVVYKAYTSNNPNDFSLYTAVGKIFVLAANPVENSKLMLKSLIKNDLIGKYLMDHPFLLTWGLSPQLLGIFKGPGSTSGIESLRNGKFREHRSAFRIEIGNLGWLWSNGAPYSIINSLVFEKNNSGKKLRESTYDMNQRQIQLGFMLEQPAEATNRITIDRREKDSFGNLRPIINYKLSEYTIKGMEAAKQTASTLYSYLGAKECTSYTDDDPGFIQYNNNSYAFSGAGHFMGGHVMGTSIHNSVVDKYQKVWGYKNLFAVGCGSLPTTGTANPTLTLAALALMSAKWINNSLEKEKITIGVDK
ncbi:GMC oxidoreductase [Robertmurraya kyonggiensis]|uniref:GMC family oxidoreductase n=1 Tax=Robertmurraya kyonggiensis TaxID=1037680 RepID=A0A4U1D9J4_9BACI|nr:GMC family oxidoreductase [Robertmurraya kyonggiensis]TKC19104.1 GMC family oxidoreductase [Robertmurraya kyonggiensis]